MVAPWWDATHASKTKESDTKPLGPFSAEQRLFWDAGTAEDHAQAHVQGPVCTQP